MNPQQIDDLCEQIRAGASNSDVAQWLADFLQAELAALRAQEAKYQKAIEYAEECFRDAESRANEATVELAAARERADRTEAECRDCTIALTVWSQRAEKAEAELAALRAERDAALVAVKAMHKLLDRDWAIVDRDITLRCESHDQAWNYLHEMRDLVRAALGER